MWRDSKGNPAIPPFGFAAPPRAQWSPLVAPPGMRWNVTWWPRLYTNDDAEVWLGPIEGAEVSWRTAVAMTQPAPHQLEAIARYDIRERIRGLRYDAVIVDDPIADLERGL